MLPTPTAEDYLWQFQRLLPRGRIWHRGWGTVEAAQLLTLMPQWVRLHARADQLLTDAFPCSTQELLPEWEASLGLPDPCVQPPPATLQQRAAAVCAKFRARGGQSVSYFIALAASLGYDITIRQIAPFRVGINRAGDPLYGAAWAFAWIITAPPTTVTYFRVGRSTVGEPLASWGNSPLECMIRANAPAHTIPLFEYAAESIWDKGASIWDDAASRWDVGYYVKPVEQDWLTLKLPARLRRAFLDLAAARGIRPDQLLSDLMESPDDVES